MHYELFGRTAPRYDLHTPPHHYQNDHSFILDELQKANVCGQILDVGCGTGIFLERARNAGIEAFGIDASAAMIDVACKRLAPGIAIEMRMQALSVEEYYQAIVSLSWSFNYCESLTEAKQLIKAFFRATYSGGRLVLQVAHAANATGRLMEDRELGPRGESEDILFLYRFSPFSGDEPRLCAQYVYACKSLNELLFEDHILNAADVEKLAEIAHVVGYEDIKIFNSYRRDSFSSSVSPFIVGTKPGQLYTS